jgi:hypothetical protein
MTPKFLYSNKNRKQLISKYKQYRKIATDLTDKIAEELTTPEDLRAVGRLMGILREKTFVFESEEEFNFLNDFRLFEYLSDGKNFIQRYQEKEYQLDEKQTEVINASILSYTSLFKIIKADPESATITLNDLLNNEQEIEIININLSQTAQIDLLIFTRIMPFSDFNMTSGMFCLFPKNSERFLLKQVRITMKTVKSEIGSIRRFIAFFKLNRKKGLRTNTIEI